MSVPVRPPSSQRRVNVGQFISIRVRVVREDQQFGYEVQPVASTGLPVDPKSTVYLTREEIVESQV